MYIKMRSRKENKKKLRENIKIVEEGIKKIEEGNCSKRRWLAFFDYFNRIVNLIFLQLF